MAHVSRQLLFSRVLLTALLLVLLPIAAHADEPTAVESDGPAYPVSEFVVEYVRDNPQHPPLEQMMLLPITLGRSTTGYVAPREGLPLMTFTLEDVRARPIEEYHASAIQHILEQLRNFMSSTGIIGVYVAPDPLQISETGQDLRPGDDHVMRLLITTGIVTELRTVASGERVKEDVRDVDNPPDGNELTIDARDRINHPVHARIRERSPIQPWDETTEQELRSDLLRKNLLDRYLFHLSRHPGRRVDAAVSAAQEAGGVSLDYMVTENRPLVLYAQISNTGTESTDRLRERFGLIHTQLTNADDILSLDYVTANFDEVHAFVGSYERPFENDRVRWRIYGGYNEYTASEVGFQRDAFRGQSWNAGGEIIWNFWQQRESFLDAIAGARFMHVNVDNRLFDIEGTEEFFIPYAGLAYERQTEWFQTNASLIFEFQPDLTSIDQAELDRLGRFDPDKQWTVMRWNATHSFYLEPLLNREAWEDPTTPESSTLAHEILASFKGQYAFGNRLIPQEEQVAGGLYTVRGYPQSVIAGDTLLLGTLEYRFHLPRALAIQSEPGELFGETFRVSPQYVYGTPDWDLILKGFVDAGRVMYSDPLAFENDETLIGAGVGIELLYRRNLNIRLDWGFALRDLEQGDVNAGSNRLYFVVTLLF